MKNVLFALTFILLSLNGHSQEKVDNSNNPKYPGKLKLKFENRFVLVDETNDVHPYRIVSFGVDLNHNIFLLDGAVCQVLHFDEYGKFVKKFGGKGQGPGEFEFPASLTFAANNEIIVLSINPSKVTMFSAKGTYQKDIKLENMKYHIKFVYYSNCSLLWHSEMTAVDKKIKKQMVIERVDDRLNKISTLYKGPKIDLQLSLQNPLTGLATFGVNSKCQLFVFPFSNEKYEISVYNQTGKHLKTIAKQYKPVRYSKIEITEYQDRIERIKKQNPAANYFYQKRKMPKYRPSASSLLIDSKDRIWVFYSSISLSKELSQNVDVFSPEGIYVDKLNIKKVKEPVFYLRDNYLYVLETDSENEIPYIDKYEIEE